MVALIFSPNIKSIIVEPAVAPITETVEDPNQIPPENGDNRDAIRRKHFNLQQEQRKVAQDYWDFDYEVRRYEESIGSNPSNDDLEELYRLKDRLSELEQLKQNSFYKLYDFSKANNIPLWFWHNMGRAVWLQVALHRYPCRIWPRFCGATSIEAIKLVKLAKC